jgi:hypothetical protein
VADDGEHHEQDRKKDQDADETAKDFHAGTWGKRENGVAAMLVAANLLHYTHH